MSMKGPAVVAVVIALFTKAWSAGGEGPGGAAADILR
jgi:hypothetical protein